MFSLSFKTDTVLLACWVVVLSLKLAQSDTGDADDNGWSGDDDIGSISLGISSSSSSTFDLFSSFGAWDVAATLAILFGSMVAAGGGLGGGGIFVPVFILLLSLTTKKSAALSQATIFGGSLVNLVMNFREHHPNRKHRPLPDIPTILVFEPMLLGGTIIGVLMNVMFPDPLILALLIVTLAYATVRTSRKALKMWRKESRDQLRADNVRMQRQLVQVGARRAGSDPNSSFLARIDEYQPLDESSLADTSLSVLDDSSSSLIQSDYGALNKFDNDKSESYDISEVTIDRWVSIAEASGLDSSVMTLERAQALEPLIENEKQIMKPMAIMGVIWIVVSLFSVFKSNESIVGVVSCSVVYWCLVWGVFPFLFVITVLMGRKQLDNFESKRALGWMPAQGDIQWNTKKIILYPVIAAFAGLMGGLLGIGGGMIVSPLLLELGMTARVAAATSAIAVLVTSSSATLQYALLGYLEYDYMCFFMAVGILGTFVGQTLVNFCVKKLGRQSVVVFAVAVVIALAVVLMGADGIINFINGDTSMAFTSPC